MPSVSTNRPSVRHATTASCTTRRLANELAGRFYLDRGLEKNGYAHLHDARACYALWGADGKVRQLDRLYPRLAAPEAHRPDGDHWLPDPATRCSERRQSLSGGIQRDRAANADRAADDDRARERGRGSRSSDPAGRGRLSGSGRGPGHRRQGRGRAVPGVDHRYRLSRNPAPLRHPHPRERDPR